MGVSTVVPPVVDLELVESELSGSVGGTSLSLPPSMVLSITVGPEVGESLFAVVGPGVGAVGSRSDTAVVGLIPTVTASVVGSNRSIPVLYKGERVLEARGRGIIAAHLTSEFFCDFLGQANGMYISRDSS